MVVLYICVLGTCIYFNNGREIFYGRRWREDLRYYAPMVSLPAGRVYVQDFVNFSFEGGLTWGRILQFFCKVV